MCLLCILKPLHRIMETFTHRLFTWQYPGQGTHCYKTHKTKGKLEMFSIVKV